MNPSEYTNLDRLDRTHWFYVGKRQIVLHWIKKIHGVHSNNVLLDAGMGTGTWLVEMSTQCKVIGIDDFEESLQIAQPRLEAVGGKVIRSSLSHVDLPDNSVDIVTMMDVIEHLDDDSAAVREMLRLTRPGGLVVITVPALKSLWSDWDVVLHHRRRYLKKELLALAQPLNADVLHCSYFNSVVLPLVYIVRFWRKLFPAAEGQQRAEDKIPAAPINALLRFIMVKTGTCSWFKPPAGVSLILVLRKK